ncbi:RNA-directed DNA polymerase, eukaryota, reverse transcriptase zinc-binding domain protein [Tanacetum coccineum]
MARCTNWNAIIQKFSFKLSSWKARLLSVGGRLSLIKSVLGNLPTFYMSIYLMPVSIRKKLKSLHNKFFTRGDLDDKNMTWVKWKRSIASKKDGGLGIDNIFGLNIELLFKWIWCTWGSIISSINCLKQKGIDLISICSRKISNGGDSRFWDDIWCGEQPLKVVFPRIYFLDIEKSCNIAIRACLLDWTLVLRRNLRGGWSLDASEGFLVASVHSLVDSHILDTDNEATRWNRNIPIKVNVFLWRLKLNKLPYRVNLDRRGIEVGSILCPSCLDDFETVNHSFFNCGMAKDLWSLLAKWWELDILVCDNISEWYDWQGFFHVPSKVCLFLEGGALMWSIWNFRNLLIFSSSPPKKATLWDSIVSQSFLWISYRNPNRNLSWVDFDSKTKLIGEDNESFDPLYGNYIELNDLDTPLEPKTNQEVDFEPTVVNEPDNVKTSSKCCYKMKFSCTIGYKNVNADFIPSLSVNLITKSFYYSIIKDKDDHEGKSPDGTLIDIPVFVGKFSILTGFIIIDNEDVTRDVALCMPFFMKYVSCQMIMKKFAHGDKREQMMKE